MQDRNEQFAAKWTQAQRSVRAYIASLLGDFHQCDEVLQRVAVTLVRKFDEYDPAKPFLAWAIGVSKFEVLNYRRQIATDKHVFDDALLDQITDSYQRLSPELDRMSGALKHCMDQLDDRARQILELRYGSDLKPSRIAQLAQMNPGAVRMLLMRTRENLRRCIEKRVGPMPE